MKGFLLSTITLLSLGLALGFGFVLMMKPAAKTYAPVVVEAPKPQGYYDVYRRQEPRVSREEAVERERAEQVLAAIAKANGIAP